MYRRHIILALSQTAKTKLGACLLESISRAVGPPWRTTPGHHLGGRVVASSAGCWLIMSLPSQGRGASATATAPPAAPAVRARPPGHHGHALAGVSHHRPSCMRAGGTSVYDGSPSTFLPTPARGCVHHPFHPCCTVHVSYLSWTQLASHGLNFLTLMVMMIMIAPGLTHLV